MAALKAFSALVADPWWASSFGTLCVWVSWCGRRNLNSRFVCVRTKRPDDDCSDYDCRTNTGRIMFSGTFTASGIMIGADRELMDQWLWLLIAIGAAAIFVVVILLRRKKERTKEDNALLTLGLTLVVVGIIFGDDPLIGYSFIGVGVLLSIISAIKSRSKRMKQRSAN